MKVVMSRWKSVTLLAALSIELHALMDGKKKHYNIRRKDGEKLQEYDLRGRRSWGRVGLERQEAKDEGKLIWSRKK